MNHTLQEHLDGLNARLRELNAQFLRARSSSEGVRIERDIRAIRTAISHYQSALRIEHRIVEEPMNQRRSGTHG